MKKNNVKQLKMDMSAGQKKAAAEESNAGTGSAAAGSNRNATTLVVAKKSSPPPPLPPGPPPQQPPLPPSNGGSGDSKKKVENETLENLNLLLEGHVASLPTAASGMNWGNKQNMACTIRSGIPAEKKDQKAMLFGVVVDHFKDCQSDLIVLGGNFSTPWPDVRITCRGDIHDPVNVKYFSVIIHPGLSETVIPGCNYTVRRGISKTNNDSVMQFDEQVLSTLLRSATDVFEYLKKIEGMKISHASQLPSKPNGWILQSRPEAGEYVVLQIDDPMEIGVNQFVYRPNISFRVWRNAGRKPNILSKQAMSSGGQQGGKKTSPDWFMTKMGITMSAFNFWIFVEATLKTFLPEIKNLMKIGFAENFFTAMHRYRPEEEEEAEEEEQPHFQQVAEEEHPPNRTSFSTHTKRQIAARKRKMIQPIIVNGGVGKNSIDYHHLAADDNDDNDDDIDHTIPIYVD